jgi:uncharacterized protein (DUF1800 family)
VKSAFGRADSGQVPLTRRHLGAITGAAALVATIPNVLDPALAGAAATSPDRKHKPKHKHKHHKPKPKPKPKPKVGAVEHLLRRATYGATPAQVTQVRNEGIEVWLDKQLAPGKIADPAINKLMALPDWSSLTLNSWQVRQRYAGQFGTWDVMQDLVEAHIARAAWSNRQLFEVMVDFWSNHFNVTCPSSDVWDNRHLFDRDVIRKYSLGKFSDMLMAVGKSPAMLQYLGNAQSNAANGNDPNENWGRELLELHTVGVTAGYKQTDVHNSALILSGLTVEPDGGEFIYAPWMHYVGKVKVMGFSATNHDADAGEALAMSYLSYLAHHPSTARHLATKLAIRFVSDTPPASLVTKLAATYLKNKTAIAPVLKQLFLSHEFAASVDQKVRRPFEDMIATIRALRIEPPKYGTQGIEELYYLSTSTGQPPLAWAPPNGYPDVAGAWASSSSTLAKWNLHLTLASEAYPNNALLTYTPLGNLLPPSLPKTYSALVLDIGATLNVPTLNSTQIAGICQYFGVKPTQAPVSTDAFLQSWGLPTVFAMILDSSHQAER